MISHPSLQSTFVIIASCDMTYQCTLVAVFFAASRGLPLSRLIVARAIPIASQAFATAAIRHSVRGAAVVATVIVVDTTTTMDTLSTVDDVVASIVAKSDLETFFFARFFDRHRLLRFDVKKSLVAVASCNTTCKNFSLSLLLSRMTIKLFEIARSSRYDVHWLALRNTMWSSLACLLAI
jgi:hypothetical protein